MINYLKYEFIFDALKGSESCHASTVLPLDSGTVLAAWFGGSAEGRSDVDIWTARRVNEQWETAQRISVKDNMPHWNPVLFCRLDGTVCLYFKVGRKISKWRTYVVFSSDEGKTWTSPMELVPGDRSGGRGPVKNKPIRLSDGSVLAPASTENPKWVTFVDRSVDDGFTWEKQMIVQVNKRMLGLSVPMIQPTLWESVPGHVHMMTRTSVRKIYRSDSLDYGKTWCKAYPTNLPNNNSGLDVARCEDSSLVLISNPVAKNWGQRSPLTLQRSFDNGATWEEIATLEVYEHGKEYSYPAIVAVGMKLYITYTWERQKVRYCEVELM